MKLNSIKKAISVLLMLVLLSQNFLITGAITPREKLQEINTFSLLNEDGGSYSPSDSPKAPIDLSGTVPAQAQASYPFEIERIYGSGSDEGKVVFVVMGDGYISSDQARFISDAKKAVNNELEAIYPFSTLFKDKINVYAVKVISDTATLGSGTYFKSTNSNSADFGLAQSMGTAYKPTSQANMILSRTSVSAVSYALNATQALLLGMNYSQVSGTNPAGAVHELSHAFLRLGDEYNGTQGWEAPNKTAQSTASTVRWSGFIGVPAISGKYSAVSNTPQRRTIISDSANYVAGSQASQEIMEHARGLFSILNAAAAVETCARRTGEPFYATSYHGMDSDTCPQELGFGIKNTQKQIMFPSGYNRILDFAFHNCTSLEKVIIPSDISTVGDYAFLRCTALSDVTCEMITPPRIGASGVAGDPFYGVNRSRITLNVPAGTASAYLAAGWTGFKEIREINRNDAQTPYITNQLSDITVYAGESAKLTVNAGVSSGTLSYQWYETSSKTSSGGTPVNGATSASFAPPATKAGTKYYYCVVTNTDMSVPGNKTASAVSNAVSVSVFIKGELLSISRARVNSWSTSGSDAYTLNCLFDGQESTYWHSNWGTGSGSSAKSEGLADIDLGSVRRINTIEIDKRYLSNGRGPVKSVRILAHADTGNTFPNGQTMSSYTAVNVPASEINSDFAPAGWSELTNLNISGLSSSYSPRQTVTVRLPQPIEARYLRLGITSAEISGDGTANDYVQVSEIRVFGEDNISLTDAETPNILSSTPDRAVTTGENASIAVVANVSKGSLSYQWYVSETRQNSGGTAITGAISYTYSPSTSAAGVKYYYCAVTNTDETATGSKTASLNSPAISVTVTEPVLDFRITDIEISGEEELTFTVLTQGGAQPLKYAIYIIGGGEVHHKEVYTDINSFLYTPEKSGNYSVRAYAIDTAGNKVVYSETFTVN